MHADDGADNGDHGGIIDNDGSDPTQLSWWINRFTEITQTLARDLEEFPENPSASIALIQNDIPFLVADEISHVAKLQYKHVPAIAGASARSADRRAGSVGRLYRVWVGWLAGSRPQCPGVAVAPMPATSEPDRMPSGAPFRDRSGSAGCGSNGSLGTTGRSTPASAATPPGTARCGSRRSGIPVRGRRSRCGLRLGDERIGPAHGVRTRPGCHPGGHRGSAGAPAPTGEAARSRLPLRIPGVRISFGCRAFPLWDASPGAADPAAVNDGQAQQSAPSGESVVVSSQVLESAGAVAELIGISRP